MNTLLTAPTTRRPLASPKALNVSIDEDTLTVNLDDGRIVSVPTVWYPRLSYARHEDLMAWTLVGLGHGIHWENLDEDISVENLVSGQPSGEGSKSFARWKAWYNAIQTEQGAAANP